MLSMSFTQGHDFGVLKRCHDARASHAAGVEITPTIERKHEFYDRVINVLRLANPGLRRTQCDGQAPLASCVPAVSPGGIDRPLTPAENVDRSPAPVSLNEAHPFDAFFPPVAERAAGNTLAGHTAGRAGEV